MRLDDECASLSNERRFEHALLHTHVNMHYLDVRKVSLSKTGGHLCFCCDFVVFANLQVFSMDFVCSFDDGNDFARKIDKNFAKICELKISRQKIKSINSLGAIRTLFEHRLRLAFEV